MFCVNRIWITTNFYLCKKINNAMKVSVSKIGAVEKATIDLEKRLILFCGRNGTGKTYLSYLIYSLLKNTVSASNLAIEKNIRKIVSQADVIINLDLKDVYAYKKKCTRRALQNLDSTFGISGDIIKQFLGKASIDFSNELDEAIDNFLQQEIKSDYYINNLHFKVQKLKDTSEVTIYADENNHYKKYMLEIIPRVLLTGIYKELAFNPIRSAFILPVERNSIYTFKTELSLSRNALIDQMQKLSQGDNIDFYELMQSKTARYPQPITDGLTIANDLTNVQGRKKSKYYDIAEDIEREILNGSIMINKSGDVMFHSNNTAKSRRLPFHMGASIVKTLSSLIIYLKYLASEGDLVIIDEPEMNLHPDSQRLLAKVLVKLINHNLRFLISTHSDYILRDINIMIMASSSKLDGSDAISQLGYGGDYKISPSDVGAYYFDYSGHKTVSVKPIDVYENGFDVESIDDTICSQNEALETLSDILMYGDED